MQTAHLKNLGIFYSYRETVLRAYAQFCSGHYINILFLGADRCLKNTVQPKFRNSVELAGVLAETGD
jgi:hypothetical protein